MRRVKEAEGYTQKRKLEQQFMIKEKIENRNINRVQPKDAKKTIITYGFAGESINVTSVNPK